MEQKIQTYFVAEKAESVIFMLVGIIAIIGALIGLFYLKKPMWSGMAIPLILIACIQITVGATVYFRTDSQVKTLTNMYKDLPQKYVKEELTRMKIVNRNFDIYKYVEIALLVIGLALIMIEMFWMQDKPFWLGIGIGLALQSSIMLVADFFAETRADVYTAQLMELEKNLQFQ
ncbi:MAG: hypothetical protein MUC49_09475 [Raineya sp.]|jgi:hypothetical protein|nr:hypothetical protein [Raineya sp.]